MFNVILISVSVLYGLIYFVLAAKTKKPARNQPSKTSASRETKKNKKPVKQHDIPARLVSALIFLGLFVLFFVIFTKYLKCAKVIVLCAFCFSFRFFHKTSLRLLK
jgi:quinol-cytochrome oxidoreductase complex cytochrome b subunit